MKRVARPLLDQLTQLGLSELEALVYVALSADGPGTAYEVARRVGKPAANVYKAVDSLAARGAVAVRPGRKRRVSALPHAEFLGRLEARHRKLLAGASKGLASLSQSVAPGGLYALESVGAVLERARTMLAAAESIAVIDAFPRSLAALRGELDQAAARGVRLFVQAYAPLDILAESSVVVPGAAEILGHWNSEQLNLVVDGRGVLLALCDRDHGSVVEAYWSDSRYLACMLHAGMMREHAFHQISDIVAGGKASVARIRRLLTDHPTFHMLVVPGQSDLAAQVGPPPESST